MTRRDIHDDDPIGYQDALDLGEIPGPLDPGDDPAGEDQAAGEGRVVATTVVGRSCQWCGTWIDYTTRSGPGRPPRYCGKSCRNRASELRTIQARLDRQLAAGLLRTDPVREVVHVDVVREVVREVEVPGPVQYVEIAEPATGAGPTPATARQWSAHLAELAHQISTGQIAHYDHRRVWTGMRAVMEALDKTHPGGLDALIGRR